MKWYVGHPQNAMRTHSRDISRCTSVAARILLLTTAVLLAVMPLTEHFWTFDRFLQGGQDFELTLLLVLAVLCLVLLLSRFSKQAIATLIALREWLSLRFRSRHLAAPGRLPETLAAQLRHRAPRSVRASLSLPLQI